jgi:hypothetical protein
MRIHIKTTPNKELVSFNYQPKLVGILHKGLELNELHGKPALHSFSWLLNAKIAENGLTYPYRTRLFKGMYLFRHIYNGKFTSNSSELSLAENQDGLSDLVPAQEVNFSENKDTATKSQFGVTDRLPNKKGKIK